jgi:hypothetical protein
MSKKILAMVAIFAFLFAVSDLTVYANQFSAWAGGLQGSTEVFYSNRWLVSLTQFVISWIAIVGFLMYLMSFLCSALVLSNKEIFWTIDAIKKDQDGTRETNRGPFNGLMEAFRGGAKDGLNGGMDNIMVFILAFLLNFKAYSKYKNVEMGDDSGSSASAGGGKGPKYSYSDTMGTFFLKESIEAIIVTFVFSIALSGLLIRIWLTFSDALVIAADRFAQRELILALDRMLTNMGVGQYNFTIDHANTIPTAIAENIASHIFVNIAVNFPTITPDQVEALGVAAENEVFAFFGGTFAPGPLAVEMASIASRSDDSRTQRPDGSFVYSQNWGALSHSITVNNNPNRTSYNIRTISLAGVMQSAGLAVGEGSANLTAGYLHVTFHVNESFTGHWLEESPVPN